MLAFGLASRNKGKAASDCPRYDLLLVSLQIGEAKGNPVMRVGAFSEGQSEKAALGQSYRRRVAVRLPDKAEIPKAPCQRLNRQMFRGHYPALAKASWMPMQSNALKRHMSGDHGQTATRKRLRKRWGPRVIHARMRDIRNRECQLVNPFHLCVAITGRDALPNNGEDQ